jgi:ferredoxin
MYRVEIDRTLCIGYGLCAQTAPGSLRLDGEGRAEDVPGARHDEDVVEAALTCPMDAIAVRSEGERAAA